MRIGAHVDSTDPLAAAAERGAEVVQFFLTDPQSYAAPSRGPTPRRCAPADVDIYIHAPYRLNVATTNNRIRIPSRKLLLQHAQAAAEIGAKGLIVHGGHVDARRRPRRRLRQLAQDLRLRRRTTAASRCRS